MTQEILKTVRVTVPLDPKVHAVFKHLAEVSGMSVGRAMGEWLADTSEAAVSMADLLQKAREQPKLVAKQIEAYSLGLSDITAELLESLGKAGGVGLTPPVGNTGGKLSTQPKNKRGKGA